jgi:tetratricopeptide (TPR) repeat protein
MKFCSSLRNWAKQKFRDCGVDGHNRSLHYFSRFNSHERSKMSPAAKVRHLHVVLGKQERVVEETGVEERVIRHVMNDPGYRPSATTRALIEQNYDRIVPFPMPPDLHPIREELIEAKADPGKRRLENVLIKIDALLRLAHPQSPADRLSLRYLRVLGLMSKGLHHGGNVTWFGGPAVWKQALADAEDECELAMQEADEVLLTNLAPKEREMIEQLRPFLLINWLQLIAEQAKEKYKRTAAEAESLLRKRDAVQSLRKFLERNPFLWQAAYNGLEIASTLKSDGDALDFYKKLKELDPGFESFDYAPGEVRAISAEPGMAYFSQRYREQLHKPIIRKNAKRKVGA